VTPPTRQTVAGQVYLDLRRLAKSTARPTEELLVMYALEGFLDRLTQSDEKDHFVLKGGVLLAAYDARRATRDIDFAAQAMSSDVETIVPVIHRIMSVELHDGLSYDTQSLGAQIIREDDDYNGVRVTASVALATAKLHFHLDINFGDPIWPEPTTVSLPRLLGTAPIQIAGYPVSMILAEKIVTVMQRGTANTRWRDFVDIRALLGSSPIDTTELRTSIEQVARYRAATIRPLAESLAGFPPLAQARWSAWRRNQRLETTTPDDFAAVLEPIITFTDRLFDT
jgi:Nucleotidyl transferase AbiEii toxin, Type IV TA system